MTSLAIALRNFFLVLAGFGLVAPQQAPERLTKELAEYHEGGDPVHQAKIVAKLGSSQVEYAKSQLDAGDDVAALHTLQAYRDEVRETEKSLKDTGVNAEKKPAGFKDLQISLRESIRRIDDMILSMPVDDRPFFREVRTELANVQNELIDLLFPRQPGKNPKKESLHP